MGQREPHVELADGVAGAGAAKAAHPEAAERAQGGAAAEWQRDAEIDDPARGGVPARAGEDLWRGGRGEQGAGEAGQAERDVDAELAQREELAGAG